MQPNPEAQVYCALQIEYFKAKRATSGVVPESELKKAHDRIRRLENILGRKTEEVEVLKEAMRLGREKNSSRVHHCAA